MKKILLFAVLLTMVIASCKKKITNPSITVTVSFPTINFTSGTSYYSIPVGGALPAGIATAYDSFYKENLSVVLIDSGVNNLVPGIYTAVATATSKYGYVKDTTYYVAVTSFTGSLNLSGNWYQIPLLSGGDSTATTVQLLANGFYSTSNVIGANTFTDAANVLSALFVVTSDTTILFGAPLNDTVGVLNTTRHILGDTTMTYDSPVGTIVFSKN